MRSGCACAGSSTGTLRVGASGLAPRGRQDARGDRRSFRAKVLGVSSQQLVCLVNIKNFLPAVTVERCSNGTEQAPRPPARLASGPTVCRFARLANPPPLARRMPSCRNFTRATLSLVLRDSTVHAFCTFNYGAVWMPRALRHEDLITCPAIAARSHTTSPRRTY